MKFRARFEQLLNIIWYPGVVKPNYLIKFFLSLIQPFFALARIFHNQFSQAVQPKSDLTPLIQLLENKLVIVLGNITVGGTGKTPIVAKLYEQLSHLGYSPGIISKGYLGRKVSAEPHRVELADNPNDFGDEPVLLARRLKNCPVVVCKNRVTAIQALLTRFPKTNIILTDDGLQDKKLGYLLNNLSKDQVIKIAVIDAQRGLGNEKLLPAGPLREPKQALFKLDHIIMHQSQERSLECIGDLSSVFWVKSQIIGFEQLNTPLKYTPEQFVQANHSVRAITGIGNPERFFQSLSDLGLLVKPTAYPDHFDFRVTDLKMGDNLPIVITEKDAVKIKAFVDKINTPIWVAKLDIVGIEGLTEKIQEAVMPRSFK
jgi:tetraacyldisaccharide 4'-kinase